MPWRAPKGKMNQPMGIGITLREFRREHDLSQRELGEMCGLTHSAISRIESGERTRLQFETLRLMAQALGISVDELVAASQQAEAATA